MLKLQTAPFGVGLFAALAFAPNAQADEDYAWSFAYTGDVAGVVDGAPSQAGRYLDNIDLIGDASLEALMGWRGARVHGHVLYNGGGAPNDVAQTLQGVDNIEVERQSTRLYEFWVEQEFAGDRGAVLAGLYDLNSDFYATDAAGLLIAPAFGIGSELAATGPNGPSIFPSTALALRARWDVSEHQRIQFAALNAHAGVLGDPDGVDFHFDDGALLIAEWAYSGGVQLKLGAWAYTKRQDDIRDVDGLGAPLRRRAEGVYGAFEAPLFGENVRGFVRIGASEGDTTPFVGGWQAGVLVSHVFASRPDSALSIGVNQGVVSDKFRDNAFDAGEPLQRAESAIEFTYADRIGEHVTLQPDLQFIRHPAANGAREDVVVVTMRVGVEF
jgi:porin